MERLVTPIISLIESWPIGWGTLLLWIIAFNLLAFGILGNSMGIKDFWKMYFKSLPKFLLIGVFFEGAVFIGAGGLFVILQIIKIIGEFFLMDWDDGLLWRILFLAAGVAPIFMQYYLIFPKHRDETLALADLTPEKKRILAICLSIVNAVPWIFMVYVAFTMGLFEIA